MKKWSLEFIVFICGAVVMILELVGSRMLAPYFGTSIVVWTGLIGVILASMSLGYWWGGKIADKNANYKQFALIIFSAALFIFLSAAFQLLVLLAIYSIPFFNIYIKTIAATLLLFAPASIALGMVSPYSVRLKIKNINSSGETVGNLYAISTCGSIVGTFLSGFVLITYLSHTIIMFILSFVLILLAVFIAGTKKIWLAGAAMSVLIAFAWLGNNFYTKFQESNGLREIDTAYNRVFLQDKIDIQSNRPVRYIITGPGAILSGMYLDNPDELLFPYTKFYDLAGYFNPGFKKTLMIGGAGYSYPKYFLDKYPDATMDVAEIDPQMTEIAKSMFDLKDNSRLNIYHLDGRIFLNSSPGNYDAIFGDAFTSAINIPYNLTTKEAVEKMFDVLNDKGVVVVNIISSVEGDKSGFLQAEYATFKSVFPQVYVFPVQYKDDSTKVQNVMLVAWKSNKQADWRSDDKTMSDYLSHRIDFHNSDKLVLTDEYAPVENFAIKLLNAN